MNKCPICGGRILAERGWYYSEIYEVDENGYYDSEKPIKTTVQRDYELDDGKAVFYCENDFAHYMDHEK